MAVTTTVVASLRHGRYLREYVSSAGDGTGGNHAIYINLPKDIILRRLRIEVVSYGTNQYPFFTAPGSFVFRCPDYAQRVTLWSEAAASNQAVYTMAEEVGAIDLAEASDSTRRLMFVRPNAAGDDMVVALMGVCDPGKGIDTRVSGQRLAGRPGAPSAIGGRLLAPLAFPRKAIPRPSRGGILSPRRLWRLPGR